jgi:hypothetical protein
MLNNARVESFAAIGFEPENLHEGYTVGVAFSSGGRGTSLP